jgi:hypothetical protein
MSAWRLLVKALAERGGEAPLRVIGEGLSEHNRDHGILRARELGLVEWPETVGRGSVVRITPLGAAFARGEAKIVRERCRARGRGFSRQLVEEVQS